jgi:hypothetical protein
VKGCLGSGLKCTAFREKAERRLSYKTPAHKPTSSVFRQRALSTLLTLLIHTCSLINLAYFAIWLTQLIMVKPPSPQTTSNTVRLSDLGTDTTGFIYLPTRTGGSARFPLTVLRDKDLDTAHKAFPERNLASLETHPGRRDRGRKKAEFASATALLRARAEYYGGREPAQTGDELERGEQGASGSSISGECDKGECGKDREQDRSRSNCTTSAWPRADLHASRVIRHTTSLSICSVRRTTCDRGLYLARMGKTH